MLSPHPLSWSDTTCLLCGAPPNVGHTAQCPSLDPNATWYLTERLPDGTVRQWTMAGARYTATPARREAIAALLPTMLWQPADRPIWLPVTVAWLIQDVVPQMGVARWLTQIGYQPGAAIRVPDCGCTEPLRCRCDVDGHPHTRAHPDLWADCRLVALRLRRPLGWLDLWLLDIGTGAVVVADDERTDDPVPVDASRSCQMGWCDRCDGTRPAGRPPTPHTCTHTCHASAATTPPLDASGPHGHAGPPTGVPAPSATEATRVAEQRRPTEAGG